MVVHCELDNVRISTMPAYVLTHQIDGVVFYELVSEAKAKMS